jgi:uncharacterized membrane protein YphA (DoxX/SURF4 family)
LLTAGQHFVIKVESNMTSVLMNIPFGGRIYGLGVMALALLFLSWGDFIPGQPVASGFPGRTALAYAAGASLLIAGAAIEIRRTAAWAAAALTAYYAVVILLMNGRLLLVHFGEYGTYENIAEQLSIAAGALTVYAATARIDGALAARLTRLGQLTLGACALVFGGAHFVYMNLTAPLVPKWLPPSQVFWGYTTGVCFFAAGIALLTGIQGRLAAILLTIMLGSFAILIHEPTLLADPRSLFNWSESVINFTIIGAAWVIADSLARPRRSKHL